LNKKIHTVQSFDKKEFEIQINLFIQFGCELIEQSYQKIKQDIGLLYSVDFFIDISKDSIYSLDLKLHDNKKIKRIGYRENGLKVDKWLSFYDNGQKESEMIYTSDFLYNGKEIHWSKDGKVLKERTWKDGEIWDGESSIYYRDEMYIKLKIPPPPPFSFETPGDRLAEKGLKKNGKKVGGWTFWSKDGKKSWKCEFKNGEPWNGIYRTTYHTAEKLSEENYKEGKKDGTCHNWYGNGNLRSSGEYLNDRKHGLWTYGSANGQESWELEYINDEPVNGLLVEYAYAYDFNEKKILEGNLKDGQRIDEWKTSSFKFDKNAKIEYKNGEPYQGQLIETIHCRTKEKGDYLEICEKSYTDGDLVGIRILNK
jgi:antitoxin component YwqK of YwqJK toxin-antitoxin module|tara:strand:+ start:57 stop:1160 length:1104 start_codon:yes stop_codon:yes gene_type:complete